MTGKLLIVDDSATDRLIIKNMLNDYETVTAQNGREAMRLLQEQPDIDLIILDLNMPVMNGFEVLDELKEINKDKRIRAIILTNYDELDNEIRGLQAGAVDFIRKPINLESLRLRIGIHLELLQIQKLYAQTLYERNLTLDTLLNQAPVGIALSHGENPGSDGGEKTIFNIEYQRITGRTREELIKFGWADYASGRPSQRGGVLPPLQGRRDRNLQDGEAIRAAGRQHHLGGHHRRTIKHT